MAKAIQSFSLTAVFFSIMESLLKNNFFWQALLDEYKERHPFNRTRYNSYKLIVENENFENIVDSFLSKTYVFSLPQKVELNKISTQKKRIVYILNNTDDLFVRAINKYLTEHYSYLVSDACHSFQKGKGAKSAFKAIFKDKMFNKKDILKIDIKNFYNSINIDDFFRKIPDEIKSNDLIFHYLEKILKNDKVLWNDKVVCDKKGLMAGISIAPFLSNLYLKDIDNYFVNQGVTYARYSDDIILFDYPSKILEHLDYIKYKFDSINLQLNNDKTNIIKSGEKWNFLGFSYHKGIIDISENTVKKLKQRVKRLSRRYYKLYEKGKYSEKDILKMFIDKINRKLYGKSGEEADLCWSRWFFPLINTSKTLIELDHYIQNKLRFSVCGRYSKMNFKKIPYKMLQSLDYKPLNSMYYLFILDYKKFNKIIKNF